VTGLGELRAAVEAFAADDPAALPSAALLDQVIELRQLIDGLEGTWSRLLAAVDGSGAAEAGTSTFLRLSCRLAPATARTRVMLARRLARRRSAAEVAQLVERLLEVGLRGIEVFHSEHAPPDCEQYAELARRFGLIPTGGSDSHGLRTGYSQVGDTSVAADIVDRLREAAGRDGGAKALGA